jgi:citrate synthase
MPVQLSFLTAREAAERLGISLPTLYAYVSRGLLRSEAGEGGSRARRYRVEDVEALAARKEYRRQPAKAAESALDFGLPVLESAITLIEHGKLYYRGRDATTLAREHSFEEVATLLWTGDLAAASLFAPDNAPPAVPPLPFDPAGPIERYQATLALASTYDLAAHQLTPPALARTGARILTLLTQASTGATSPPAGLTLAYALQRAWAPEQPEAVPLLSAALILCADHELNVSAFTARCVASAGSPPYAVVIAALSALQGHRHGGITAQTAALLAAATTQGVRGTLAGYLRGGALPGFGHPLYPEGDPRARYLLDMLAGQWPHVPAVQVTQELCAAVFAALGLHPTIDLALATVSAAIGAPPQSALSVFALGRTTGWLAHAGEQYALGQLIRPRAQYVGPLPAAAARSHSTGRL